MSIIAQLSDYLDAKKAYEEYQPMAGEYSPWKQALSEKLIDAERRLEEAVDRLIDDRIEAVRHQVKEEKA